MENASKALLMAGGVLLGLIIIYVIVLMASKIKTFQNTGNQAKKESQVASLNRDFEKYTDEDIKGVDIITLINKVLDFNNKDGVENYINYDHKIKLTVNLKEFDKDHGRNGELLLFKGLPNDQLVINKSEDKLKKNIYNVLNTMEQIKNLENEYSLKTMNLLSANYDSFFKKDGNGKTTDTPLGTDDLKAKFKEITGKDLDSKFQKNFINTLKCYREYSEFKMADFAPDNDYPRYDQDGQISELSFTYKRN